VVEKVRLLYASSTVSKVMTLSECYTGLLQNLSFLQYS
jgi:hypothetical protein